MLYFVYENQKLASISEEYVKGGEVRTRNDMDDMDAAWTIAGDATMLTGDTYLAVDRGPSTWPRFDVIKAPVVGEPISRAINGDYYPDGTIVNVSKSFRVVTSSTGERYFRRGQTGSWLSHGCWSMVPGHIERRNPHI